MEGQRPRPSSSNVRTDWTREEVRALFELPFFDLLLEAQLVHREHHEAGKIELATLLSIKTGGCPEDCGYCSQSAFAKSGVKPTKLMDTDAVVAEAERARSAGATRFCMGAAWREPKDRDMDRLCDTVRRVKDLGLETCMTLGMLSRSQADRLAQAGLDFYNHNLDTSPEHYSSIISTRTYADRLETLDNVRSSGMAVCCGGIVGMGESREDRVGLLHSLATLPSHPESVPVNALIPIAGTQLGNTLGPRAQIDDFEFVRTIAVARILMPRSVVRLSAGRETMPEGVQALCFLAGANSIFFGEALLTAANPSRSRDLMLLEKLDLAPLGSTLEEAAAANPQPVTA